MFKSILHYFEDLFIRFILLDGDSRIENRANGTYLVWASKGHMAIPPMAREVKLTSK